MSFEARTFEGLVSTIERTHVALTAHAGRAVNMSLTLRNWMIGLHIQEYEQAGADRAAYGARLLDTLAVRLRRTGLHRVEVRELRRFRQFYAEYPQIRETLSPELTGTLRLGRVAAGVELSSAGGNIRETPSAESALPLGPPAGMLLARLSFSHFAELLQVEDQLARRFYEVEAVRGTWSVRELRRQIATQYYARTALSPDKATRTALVRTEAEGRRRPDPRELVRDPYVFEFLGLTPSEAMAESALEDALLDKLQDFLLELGHGFCFEARQKRLVIGGEHFFVDLVFYHRVLKCHVLVELKTDVFRHEHFGQLNAHVSCYRQTQMTDGDQPPVGILLCTAKNHAMVEYALAGMANTLFVSRYQVRLPGKEEMTAFVQRAVEELGGGDE